ncbi:AlpA family phage regulatory protein [Marinobacter sp. NFXS9]
MNISQHIESSDSLMTLREVSGIVKLSRTSIYRKEKTGDFPRAIRLGARALRWRKSDIQGWIEKHAEGGC